MYVFIKLNEKSSLYKALKQRDIIDYRGYIPLTLDFLPRVGESFVLPYGKLSGNKCNETLKKYLNNRNNNTPIMKVNDIIIHEAATNHVLYYLKCDYVSDSDNWL